MGGKTRGNLRHGKYGSKEYVAWRCMKTRCLNKNSTYFRNYGGRGIGICTRWVDSFENFFLDMGLAPSSSSSLDRIDGAKGYEPGNCRWATRSEQNNNKRNNRLITMDGETKNATEWARALGISKNTIMMRLHRGKTRLSDLFDRKNLRGAV